MSYTPSTILTDRHGVPQYQGEAELFEEYEERAVHLRAGLSGAAYESVRKLEHNKLKTKTSEGKPTDVGMKLLLQTLRESIAAELPVKTSELFFQAFYPNVWRRNNETMQQYIVRREQDFKRLEENSTGTQVSEQIRAMMLLCFGGLDPKEQTSVLSSCNNTYEFQKIAHAMRIQFPNSAGKPVVRRDYLGARGGSSFPNHHVEARWKARLKGKTRQILAVEEDAQSYDNPDDEAYFEDDEIHQNEEDSEEAHQQGYSDDDLMGALLSEFPDMSEDPQVAEAFATVAQHRFKKKKFMGRPTSSLSSTTSTGSPVGFTAKGEMSFSEKARDQRRSAVKFLKSVTPCTVCHQKGHWAGDAECPGRKGKGKGKGKTSGKKKPQKIATTLFVSHGTGDPEETADTQAEDYVLSAEATSPECYLAQNVEARENVKAPLNVFDPAGIYHSRDEGSHDLDTSFGMFVLTHYAMDTEKVPVEEALMSGSSPDAPIKRRTKVAFSHVCDESEGDEADALMALRCPKLCEHSSYNGGSEKKFHRGANGHTRFISCKEKDCDKTVIVGHRREAVEMWSYFIQILMCTKWGQDARSAGLFRRVCQVRVQHDHEQRALQDPSGLSAEEMRAMKASPASPLPLTARSPLQRTTARKTAGPLPGSPPSNLTEDGWSVYEDASHGYPSPSSPAKSTKPTTAKIVRATRQRVWLYGVMISADSELPPLPELDILQPLPHDSELINDGGPFQGHCFKDVSENVGCEHYCKSAMTHVLSNEPASPEIFRFAFYLYGRLRLVKSCCRENGEALQGRR